ncbi:MAG TPA: DciA family protein [Terriglobales bacterium]|nr:DciA family protein [Terriglobales bacterium]
MERLRDILAQTPQPGAELPAELGPALAWTLAAGPHWAARAGFVGLREGTLAVRAQDEATRRQLASIAPELCRSLDQMLGGGRVRRLEIES